jgi:uncharacterized protein (TIGR03083 family)
MAPEGKDHILKVDRAERGKFYDVVSGLDDAGWQSQTACGEWQARDVVGHMVDVTEAYLERWAIAREGKQAPEPLGLRPMAAGLDKGAKRFRDVPQQELIARLKRSSDKLYQILDGLSDQQWTGEMVSHVYMGPLPAFFYPAFQLMDYAVHTWDIRKGLGQAGRLDEDAAGTLVPYMFILMQATMDSERAKGLSCSVGINISGRYGGSWRVKVADGAFAYEPGPPDECGATFSFDASDFVLSAFQRIRGGVAEGDPQLAEQFRDLFFKI